MEIIKIALIVFFSLLIIWQFIFPLKEGMDYQDYDWNKLPDDPATLATQNAQNIQVLKDQMDNNTDLTEIQQTVEDLSGNVVTLTQQVQDVIDAQKNYAQDNLPSDPVEISGT